MKRILLSSAVVLALTVAGGAAYKASADTTPPPPDMAQPPGPPPSGPWGGPGGPGRSWGKAGWGPGRGLERDEKFSLFAPVSNKDLSVSDVKIIASAILLEHGNHAWSVADIDAEPDKSIQFSFTTQHGDVIATFAIDPATGRIKRIS